jgi:DNA polymerase elongation subunit (family B)
LNEGAILTYLKRKNVIAPNKPTTTNPSIREINLEDHIVHQRGTPSIEGFVREIKDWQVTIQTVSGQYLYRSIKTIKKKDSYAGGYLLEPIPGLHSWMSDYDYSSYYPSCIMSLNIGIETLVGWVVSPNLTRELWNGLIELEEMNPDDILTIGRLDLSTYQIVEKSIKVSKVLNSIKKNNWNVTANGVIYRTDKTSIASDILSDWFDMRKKLKDEMKVAYGNNDMELYDYLDIKQLVFKVLLNAMYGGFAVNSFRFTDGFKLISSSITCTCQRLIQETIKYANEMIEEEYLGK